MNKDSKLIFEAYKKKLEEMAKYAKTIGFKQDPRTHKSGGYGLKGFTDEQMQSLKQAIETKLFKPEHSNVNGEEFNLLYPGSKEKFRAEIANLLNSEFGMTSTKSGYTARIIDNLLDVISTDDVGATVAQRAEVDNAIERGAEGKDNTGVEVDVEGPEADNVLDSYAKGEYPVNTPEYKEILDELKPIYKVRKGEDVLTSPELVGDINLAIKKLKRENPKFDTDAETFLSDVKFHRDANKRNVFQKIEHGEGIPDEDIPTEPDDASQYLKMQGLKPKAVGSDPGNFSFSDY